MNVNSHKSERWRTISSFERYSVSDQGRIGNDSTGRILQPRVSNHGTNKHAKVRLASFDGPSKEKFVHRLVAEAMIGPCEGRTI